MPEYKHAVPCIHGDYDCHDCFPGSFPKPLDAFDRIVDAAHEESVSLADMHNSSPDGDYRESAESLDAALKTVEDLRRMIESHGELLDAAIALLADADDREETHTQETGEEYADYKALRQAIAKAKGGSNE